MGKSNSKLSEAEVRDAWNTFKKNFSSYQSIYTITDKANFIPNEIGPSEQILMKMISYVFDDLAYTKINEINQMKEMKEMIKFYQTHFQKINSFGYALQKGVFNNKHFDKPLQNQIKSAKHIMMQFKVLFAAKANKYIEDRKNKEEQQISSKSIDRQGLDDAKFKLQLKEQDCKSNIEELNSTLKDKEAKVKKQEQEHTAAIEEVRRKWNAMKLKLT